ncbi:hypothetical protein HMPREF9120_02644, partial [Neisseria sp. oral taxon 020 str. F0370]
IFFILTHYKQNAKAKRVFKFVFCKNNGLNKNPRQNAFLRFA